ncbi:MAG: TIGR00645 family protein [Pseudomonadota bacterium]
MNKSAESAVERTLLASRWLLLPLYMVLSLILIAFGAKAMQEFWHLATHLFELTESQLVLATLSIIDMTLVASLIVMVALSGYETFISPFDTVGEMEKPSWLGKLDTGTVKVKLAISIVSISAIHLLKTYLSIETLDNARILTLTAVHLAFVGSALLLAYVDRIVAHKAH